MSDIQRIKKLMMISEQEQIPVTSPVNLDALILLLNHMYEKNPELFEDIDDEGHVFSITYGYNDEFENLFTKNSRLFGLPKFDGVIEDFYGLFIKDNLELISKGETDKSKYTIPKLKKFLVEGEERYTARKGDIYELTVDAYSEEYVKDLISHHEIMISDGKFVREEFGDTWDMEQEIIEIHEIPFNKNKVVSEQSNLDDYRPSFTSEEFVNYVNSEFDMEMLELMRNVIDKRIKELNTLLYMANRREIKGFRK